IELHARIDQLSAALDRAGDAGGAAACQDGLHRTLEQRGVLPSVLDEITVKADAYRPSPKAKSQAGKKQPKKKQAAKGQPAKTQAGKKRATKSPAADKRSSGRK
ncbi:MAG: hypothetical protein QNM02_11750, partial [Acidimicrobiia bacterium]|nr:hypothetical protein [Acidimicrobiia bacterium]